MYLKIFLIILSCIDWLLPTTYLMFSVVHIMINIKLFTVVDAYYTEDIFIPFISLLRNILEYTLKLTGSEIKISLQSCMLKPHKIFFK